MPDLTDDDRKTFQHFWANSGWDGKALNALEAKLSAHLAWANAEAGLRAEISEMRASIDQLAEQSEGWKAEFEDQRAENTRLRQRLAELEAAGAWRPIETAPKDVSIAGYHHLWKRPQVRECHFREGEWIAYDAQSGWYQVGIPPSHFQPLPAPPPRTT
jgi:hypothetical protein